MEFQNREHAGRLLSLHLAPFAGPKTVICALPRGGVPVAAPIAKALAAPLSFLFVQKISAPSHSEVAIGALVDGDEPTLIREQCIIKALHVSESYIVTKKQAALLEIERRKKLYRGLYPDISLNGKIAILVDDGLATGASMAAAIKAARKQGAATVIVAIPVGPLETIRKLDKLADKIVCLEIPSPFWCVGKSYVTFQQLDDADVIKILKSAASDNAHAPLDIKQA